MADSLVMKIDENTYTIGNIYLEKDLKEITIPGHINMEEGLIEYLAVTEYGKTHESIAVLDIQPLHLQIALLLFGLDYGRNLEFQGDSIAPRGDSVIIELAWINSKGDSLVYSASELVKDYRTQTAMQSTAWIFTGSALYKGNFLADLDGSIIATYGDPAAILNNPLAGRVDDMVYGANDELLPEPGTKIKMRIKIP